MIPFFEIVQGTAYDEITPEQNIARQMGIPLFPVTRIDGQEIVRCWAFQIKDDSVGLIFDPEFWYSPVCWAEWLRHVEADAPTHDIHVPLGTQNASWRDRLDIPVYATLRQLEVASEFCSAGLWKIAKAEHPNDFAVAVVPTLLLKSVPETLLLSDLPAYWSETHQSIRIFCKGWLHAFSAVREEGRRNDLISMCDWKGTVLELGCGAGLMAANCQDKGFDVNWVGLDIDLPSLQQATAHMDLAIRADLNQDLPFDSNLRFDRIVCGDVLEHLPYPWIFLSRIQKHIRPDGLLIASFPNVGHWSVIEDLLAGRWDETPSGTFCVTHLRFGTKTSWQRWFEQSGWHIIRWESEVFPLPKNWRDVSSLMPVPLDVSQIETIRYRVVAAPK